ncbi:hypothetical protein [Terasakiella sp. SH-1]|uniref:hypothetical protein n=1 Tax=Terasakiella sp. SH-1 TaxID=2560057 RepID=UPI001073F849|nr:hypothetical protein [Terasakiella sp. SH-1]
MYPFAFETAHAIGPHEGHELNLMIAGDKPCAFFSDTIPGNGFIPLKDFTPFVQSGQIKQFEHRYRPTHLPEPYDCLQAIYFCLPGEEYRVEQLHELHVKLHQGKWREEDDIIIGRLLGYKEWDIKAFIQHQRRYFQTQET